MADADTTSCVNKNEADDDDMDFYELLGVQKDAKPSDIRKSYLIKAKLHHPDRHNANKHVSMTKSMTKIFQKVGEAYLTLSDPELRRDYNRMMDYLDPTLTCEQGFYFKNDSELERCMSVVEDTVTITNKCSLTVHILSGTITFWISYICQTPYKVKFQELIPGKEQMGLILKTEYKTLEGEGYGPL